MGIYITAQGKKCGCDTYLLLKYHFKGQEQMSSLKQEAYCVMSQAKYHKEILFGGFNLLITNMADAHRVM